MALNDWSVTHCGRTIRCARIGYRAVVLHVEPRLVNVKKTVRARLRVGVLLGAGGAILVIRRDQTADVVWTGRDVVGGRGGGMARMRLPYLCKLPESFARVREGNDEISGVTVTMRRRRWLQGRRVCVHDGNGVRGNFSNPSDPTGGQTGRRAKGREMD